MNQSGAFKRTWATKASNVKIVIILAFLMQLYTMLSDAMQASTLSAGKRTGQSCNDKHSALASWWLTKAYFAEQNAPDIVVLGDSQLGPIKAADVYVYNDFVDLTGDHRSHTTEHDLKLILHKNWRVLIGGLPGAMISDQLLISRALFTRDTSPNLWLSCFRPVILSIIIDHQPRIAKNFAFSQNMQT